MELEKKWQLKFCDRARRFREPHDISHWTKRGFIVRHKKISQEVRGLRSPGERVLDVGSGPGYYSALFDNPVFFDYAPDVFARMPLRFRARALCGRLQAYPFRDRTFDGLLCVGALQCLRLRRQDLEETARILKPGAWFLFETLNADCVSLDREVTREQRYRLRQFRGERTANPAYLVFDDFVVYQGDKLAEWFTEAGLRVDAVRYLYCSDPMARVKECLRDAGGPDFDLRSAARSFYLLGQRT